MKSIKLLEAHKGMQHFLNEQSKEQKKALKNFHKVMKLISEKESKKQNEAIQNFIEATKNIQVAAISKTEIENILKSIKI